MSEPRRIGERLRRSRERVGLSPDQLDDLAGLERGSVEAYELTQRPAPSGVLRDLAAALGVPASALRSDLA